MSINYWEGSTVRLRGVEPNDGELFHTWNLDSARGQYLDFLWPPVSSECVKQWTLEQSRKKLEEGSFHWIIESREGSAVGSISTHGCDSRAGVFSQAFDIASEHRRKGYASAAVWMVLRYYFHELRYQKVLNGVHANNPASIELHEQLGFVKEGHLRRMVFTNGSYHDKFLYGMTLEEFEAKDKGL